MRGDDVEQPVAAATDPHRRHRPLDRTGQQRHRGRAVERRPQLVDRVRQLPKTHAGSIERDAGLGELGLEPPRTQTDHEPPAGENVQAGRDLGQQRRRPQLRAEHECPQPDA